MRVYTFSQARQNFASVLKQASEEGEARIRRKDGSVFVIRPLTPTGSPLDVKGVAIGLSSEDIVSFVREGRERQTRLSGTRWRDGPHVS
jgi:PAS domain-containing protein